MIRGFHLWLVSLTKVKHVIEHGMKRLIMKTCEKDRTCGNGGKKWGELTRRTSRDRNGDGKVFLCELSHGRVGPVSARCDTHHLPKEGHLLLELYAGAGVDVGYEEDAIACVMEQLAKLMSGFSRRLVDVSHHGH